MTPERKQEIKRKIAEAMGWKLVDYSFAHQPYVKSWDTMPTPELYDSENYGNRFKPEHWFNPVDSDKDALEAVDKIFPSYTLQIIKTATGDYMVQLNPRNVSREERKARTTSYVTNEIRPAAISLAIMAYLPEPDDELLDFIDHHLAPSARHSEKKKGK